MAETIPIDRISAENTQTRASLNDTVIDEYAEALQQGIELPPIELFYDNECYWLADGFHRLKAAQQLGRDSITATIHPGGQRDAILHAVGANETHGLRRTDADRRTAVLLLLNDAEWREWNSRKIARTCHVSHTFVNKIRRGGGTQSGINGMAMLSHSCALVLVEAARCFSGPLQEAVGEMGSPPTGRLAVVERRREHRVTGM